MRAFELASGDLRDRLVEAVLTGAKTATTSLYVTYEVENEDYPAVGHHYLVDRHDEPIGVVEVTKVEVVRLGDVTDAIAHAEGEGFADVAEWRAAHEHFWHAGEVANAEAAIPGWRLDDDTLVVVETFRLTSEDPLASEEVADRGTTSSDASDSFGRSSGDRLTATQLHDLLKLRVDVFVVEQDCPYPEIDGRDLRADTQHLWWPADGVPQGYLRLLTEPDGSQRIGRVCTAKSARGTGLGGRLMAAALEQIGTAAAVLDAQTYAQAFYARFGFVAEGEPFDEDGIEHIRMRRGQE